MFFLIKCAFLNIFFRGEVTVGAFGQEMRNSAGSYFQVSMLTLGGQFVPEVASIKYFTPKVAAQSLTTQKKCCHICHVWKFHLLP